MKYALIGCGRIATNHIKAVLNNHLEFAAACDVNPDNIETLLTKHGLEKDSSIARYTDYKKMIEEVILYYNFMAYTYKTVTSVVNGHKVQKKEYKDKTGRLICPRPKQKFGCDRIMERVQEFLDHENEPLYFINRLRAELQALNAPQDLIDRVVAERDSYCNNKYVYSQHNRLDSAATQRPALQRRMGL